MYHLQTTKVPVLGVTTQSFLATGMHDQKNLLITPTGRRPVSSAREGPGRGAAHAPRSGLISLHPILAPDAPSVFSSADSAWHRAHSGRLARLKWLTDMSYLHPSVKHPDTHHLVYSHSPTAKLLRSYCLHFSDEETKSVEENTGGKLLDIGLGDDFLDPTPKTKATKTKKEQVG